jgi:sulfatase maturation enzyme AslB (radical SAM superfamily)
VKASSLPRKVAKGSPYLVKELRSVVSDHTPLFIAVPRVLHIWRGAPCNAKCIMCPWGYLKGKALHPYVKSEFTDEHMPIALAQIAELSGRHTTVSYMGGEPMLKSCLIDWVEQAGSLGLDFRFTTNGYLMTEELAQRLVAAGLFNIGISLESLDPAINEVIRPYRNGTAKTIRCIDLMLAERKRQNTHTSINIKTVLTDINLESFVEIVERYGRTDGVFVTPQPFEAIDGMPGPTREKLFVKDVDRLRRTMDRIRELKSEGYNVHVTEQHLHEFVKQYEDDPEHKTTMHNKDLVMANESPDCNIGTDNLWILDGEVKLCPHHPPIGNFLTGTQTLKEMWDSELTRSVREGTRACRRLCTVSCLRRTPLRHKISTYLKIG